MKLKALALAAASLMVAAAAHAVPIVNNNVRPVTIKTEYPGEQSLQTVLDSIFTVGAVNASTDQSSAGQWSTATNFGSTIPTLVIEQTNGFNSQKFGIWFGTDTASPTTFYALDLFYGGAVGGDPSLLNYSAAGIAIGDGIMVVSGNTTLQSNCGTQINCGTFLNPLINRGSFGFYFERGDGTRAYSIDSMNAGGATDFLAYQYGTSNDWAFAFEDGTDNDYQDMVVKVESIKVPEPGSLALLGLGLAGLAAASRRKQKQA